MKSHVSLAKSCCPICGTQHSETILLDRHLRATLNPTSFLGWSLCPEHQQQANDGFVFLVELREEPQGTPTLESTWPLRTGTHIALRRSAAQQIFSVEPQQLNFCTPDLTALLQSMTTEGATQ